MIAMIWGNDMPAPSAFGHDWCYFPSMRYHALCQEFIIELEKKFQVIGKTQQHQKANRALGRSSDLLEQINLKPS